MNDCVFFSGYYFFLNLIYFWLLQLFCKNFQMTEIEFAAFSRQMIKFN